MGKKILIVDDDADFREVMGVLLESKGYIILEASDGESGYKKAKAEKPDLIILDVMMAHKSEGFDIARKIHSDKEISRIPVIISTGVTKEMNLPFTFSPDETWLPVKVVLNKPIKPDVLLKEVAKYI
ncbi:response regulator receiver protein [Candidatus Omnitrophus magneticus]|uniref:Response regulator receiver protein n=1 Tax=Candidatus Omnitrophus magneticus TaxID=1609969 RepID=A0A0F0CNL0_9BACT|nr:response regulator receiver protein [Candidatus Omnitrophus magneticus]